MTAALVTLIAAVAALAGAGAGAWPQWGGPRHNFIADGPARSTIVGANGRLVLLDEDGNLAIATPGDTGLTVHAKAPILGTQSWTVPTLSGTRLYARDRRQIVALDLGRP